MKLHYQFVHSWPTWCSGKCMIDCDKCTTYGEPMFTWFAEICLYHWLLAWSLCRCEDKTNEDVCGENGVTYMSMCHAVNCAHLQKTDITFGSCARSKSRKVPAQILFFYMMLKSLLISSDLWVHWALQEEEECSVYIPTIGSLSGLVQLHGTQSLQSKIMLWVNFTQWNC